MDLLIVNSFCCYTEQRKKVNIKTLCVWPSVRMAAKYYERSSLLMTELSLKVRVNGNDWKWLEKLMQWNNWYANEWQEYANELVNLWWLPACLISDGQRISLCGCSVNTDLCCTPLYRRVTCIYLFVLKSVSNLYIS